MKREIKYLEYLLKHKWFVMIECFKSGLIWQGLTHDLSKFSPDEFLPYAHFFYEKDGTLNRNTKHKNGYCKPTNTSNQAFDSAWTKHCQRNKHHLKYWIQTNPDGKKNILPMPEPYLTEMICDWVGAGKAQGHFSPKEDPYLNVRNWYQENKEEIQCAPKTRKEIEKRIGFQSSPFTNTVPFIGKNC